jgi:hypothetical protein
MRSVCQDTLPWLISISLDLCVLPATSIHAPAPNKSMKLLIVTMLTLCAANVFAGGTHLEANIQGYSESIASALKSYHKECSNWDKYPKACEKKEFSLWHDLIFLEGLLHAQLDRLDAVGYEGSREEKRARNERALRRVRYELDCGIGAAPDCAEQKAALLKETYPTDATGLFARPE